MGVDSRSWWDDVKAGQPLRDPTAGEIEAASRQLASLFKRYYHDGGEALLRQARDEWMRLTVERIPAATYYRLRAKARLTLRAALKLAGQHDVGGDEEPAEESRF